MAKVTAVKCDACDNMDVPAQDAEIPEYWLLVDIYEEGIGNSEGRVYCSWACLAGVAQNKANPPAKKRKRRTRAQIEADEAAKAGYEAAAGA
jgi:hypothetical protein